MKPFHGFMDNHPIPRDITGFQFKLIGNMTVRQFVYLATGAVIAAFIFFILPIPFIIRLPLAIISLSIGAAFAFIPVGGRPMDTMVANFFKALSAPTQYLYQKTGGGLQSQNTQSQQPLTNPSVSTTPPPTITNDFEASITQAQVAPISPPLKEDETPATIEPTPSVGPVDSSVNSAIAGQSELQTLLSETQRQKEELEKELAQLKSQLDTMPQPSSVIPAPAAINPSIPSPTAAKQAVGLAIPEAPNLITGIIKDPRGNPLQSILVEVKDQEDNPVRAFKTNGLGQFASATSLANGKYTLIFEDTKGVNKFDPVQIETVGSPIMPLEIISVDPREELRRSLFTNG